MIKVKSHNTNPIVIHGNGTSKNEEVYSILRQRNLKDLLYPTLTILRL